MSAHGISLIFYYHVQKIWAGFRPISAELQHQMPLSPQCSPVDPDYGGTLNEGKGKGMVVQGIMQVYPNKNVNTNRSVMSKLLKTGSSQ